MAVVLLLNHEHSHVASSCWNSPLNLRSWFQNKGGLEAKIHRCRDGSDYIASNLQKAIKALEVVETLQFLARGLKQGHFNTV